MSGGTGAAKWGSIKHCGLPWEIGLAETHQTLVLNGLRNRVTLQTDGQVRTGRDVVIAAMLGAEEGRSGRSGVPQTYREGALRPSLGRRPSLRENRATRAELRAELNAAPPNAPAAKKAGWSWNLFVWWAIVIVLFLEGSTDLVLWSALSGLLQLMGWMKGSVQVERGKMAHFALRGATLGVLWSSLICGLVLPGLLLLWPLLADFLVSTSSIGAVEEAGKLVALIWLSWSGFRPWRRARRRSTAKLWPESPRGLMLAGFSVGVGFMVHENFGYLGNVATVTSMPGCCLLQNICFRIFLNPHPYLSGIVAGRFAKFASEPSKYPRLTLSMLCTVLGPSVVLHGLLNLSGVAGRVVCISLIFVLFRNTWKNLPEPEEQRAIPAKEQVLARQIAMTTAPLITLGCIMMRKCHLNTCPVGVATQDPELRAKFTGQPEHLINFLFMVAEDGEAREIMASLGIKKFNDLIGRTDLLRPKGYLKDNPKTADLDFADLLKPAWTMESMMGLTALSYRGRVFAYEDVRSTNFHLAAAAAPWEDHELAHALDQSLVSRCSNALTEARGENQVRLKSVPINNVDRSVGGILSFEVSKKFGAEGLPEGSLHIGFLGSSGQSFGNFLAPGRAKPAPHGRFRGNERSQRVVSGERDANDYIGKGLSGGTIIVYKPKQADYDSKEAIIAGNAALYGATSGKAFFGGIAAERFAVRNSGATAVCEGVGDHGCEYMTRGTVVVLGQMGQNFAAGMSGGDKTLLKSLVSEHAKLTGSKWPDALKRFTKVFPKEYKKALLAMKEKDHNSRD
eukprot:g31744.t1